ncbi:hypothetical protein HK098_000963 [Nowakowskiella sp. JEL0407]|nr:hypothetical protein HK098_000963 [Nowakowskiella sp. JEL0407]
MKEFLQKLESKVVPPNTHVDDENCPIPASAMVLEKESTKDDNNQKHLEISETHDINWSAEVRKPQKRIKHTKTVTLRSKHDEELLKRMEQREIDRKRRKIELEQKKKKQDEQLRIEKELEEKKKKEAEELERKQMREKIENEQRLALEMAEQKKAEKLKLQSQTVHAIKHRNETISRLTLREWSFFVTVKLKHQETLARDNVLLSRYMKSSLVQRCGEFGSIESEPHD